MGRRRVCLALVATALFTISLGSGLVLLRGGVQAAYPGMESNGNWIFDGGSYTNTSAQETFFVDGSIYVDTASVTFENDVLYVNGSIEVNETGEFHATGCDIIFDGTTEYKNKINVFGTLDLDGCDIWTQGAEEYYFNFWENSTGNELMDTNVTGAFSIQIETDDVDMDACIISDNVNSGVWCIDCVPSITNSEFIDNGGWGIYAIGDAALVGADSNTFTNNADGGIWQALNVRVKVVDLGNLAVSNATVKFGSGTALDTNAAGLTNPAPVTLYTTDNAGAETYPQYTLNVSWDNGAIMNYKEKDFVLNDLTDKSTITVKMDVGPDLSISASSVELSSATPKEGSVLGITVTVTNTWGQAAKSVEVTVEGSPYDITANKFVITSIPANGTAKAFFNWTVKTYDAGGKVTITVEVDPDLNLEGNKMDRGNNVATAEVNVPPVKESNTIYGVVAAVVALVVIVVLLLMYLKMKGGEQEEDERPGAGADKKEATTAASPEEEPLKDDAPPTFTPEEKK